MVDLDWNPTKLIEIVEIGKQLLITRGSLTTFSIANDVASTSRSSRRCSPDVRRSTAQRHAARDAAVAILSAVIFNALVIVALIPLALRGVRFRPRRRRRCCAATCSVYGLGGIVAPFVGIKAIDLVVTPPRARLVRPASSSPAIVVFLALDRAHRVAYPPS